MNDSQKRIRDREISTARKLGISVADWRALKTRALRRDPSVAIRRKEAEQRRIRDLRARLDRLEADRPKPQTPQTRAVQFGAPRQIVGAK